MWIKRNRKILLLLVIFLVGIGFWGCAPGTPQPRGWSGVAITGNSLFSGSMDGRLVAIDTSSGARLWAVSLTGPKPSGGFGCAAPSSSIAIYGTPAVSGDLVYVGGYVQSGNQSLGKIYAFTNGREEPRWVYPREGYLNGPVIGGLVVSQGKVYFGAGDGKVYALDAVDGHKIAEFQTGDKIWSTPVIDGDTLYIGSFDKKLHVLDAATLKPAKWKGFVTEGAIIATPLIYKNTLYVGSFDRYLYAIDAATGSLKWKFAAGSWFWAQPLAYNDVIYAPCLDNKVYVLDAATGLEKMPAFDLRSPISSSPLLVEDRVIIASQEGKLYSLDTTKNKISQVTDLKEVIYASLSASGSTVYIHTDRDALYAVDVKTAAIRQLFFK